MRKLASLKGVVTLSKTQQRSINGGGNCAAMACQWGCCDGYCLSQGQAGRVCAPTPVGDDE